MSCCYTSTIKRNTKHSGRRHKRYSAGQLALKLSEAECLALFNVKSRPGKAGVSLKSPTHRNDRVDVPQEELNIISVRRDGYNSTPGERETADILVVTDIP